MVGFRAGTPCSHHRRPSAGAALVLGVGIHSICQREKLQFGRLPPAREWRNQKGGARLASRLEEPRTGMSWEPHVLGREGRCRTTSPPLKLESVKQSQADCGTTRKDQSLVPTWADFTVVQSLSCVQLLATPWIAALQASLFFTIF